MQGNSNESLSLTRIFASKTALTLIYTICICTGAQMGNQLIPSLPAPSRFLSSKHLLFIPCLQFASLAACLHLDFSTRESTELSSQMPEIISVYLIVISSSQAWSQGVLQGRLIAISGMQFGRHCCYASTNKQFDRTKAIEGLNPLGSVHLHSNVKTQYSSS